MKTYLARILLRRKLPRFFRQADLFHHFLGQAVRHQLGDISEEELRQHLEEFYRSADRHLLMNDLDLKSKARQLDRPGGYKVNILGLREDARVPSWQRHFSTWGRRFGLLRRLGIRADVLILRQGEQVPPHGHRHMVSGFYLLEGQVAARHYDQFGEKADRLLIRPALDTILAPGESTTNSTSFQNIHWLFGLAPVSYLFRISVAHIAPATSGNVEERLYLDPTGEPGESGLITAPYVTEAQAKAICFYPKGAAMRVPAAADFHT